MCKGGYYTVGNKEGSECEEGRILGRWRKVRRNENRQWNIYYLLDGLTLDALMLLKTEASVTRTYVTCTGQTL